MIAKFGYTGNFVHLFVAKFIAVEDCFLSEKVVSISN